MGTSVPLLMGEGLRRNAHKLPLKVAARDRLRQVTYAELNARVNRLAHALLSLGVTRGGSVALMVGNTIEHLEILFATAKIGALAIPLDVKWKALELGAVVSFFKPSLLLLQKDCSGEFAKAAAAQDLSFLKAVAISDLSYDGLLDGRPETEPGVVVDENDPFAVLLTSGTTGFPKGCLATHRTFVFHCINNAIEKGLNVHDRALLCSPIYFNAGRSFTLGIVYYGGTVFLHERFEAEKVLQTIEREQITYMGAVPTMCERLLRVPGLHRYDTTSLRCLAITGGRVHESVLRDLRKDLTPNIYRTYASTDSGQMAISKPEDIERRPAAAGMPVWCVDLRIVGEDQQPLPVGEVGEIICQSPLATQGYYMNPEATNVAFKDGWFRTGDLGYFDDEGYLFVVGRKKDMVKSGGISIYPLEIEGVLYQHPAIIEAAVVGLPDAEWGEALTAAIVRKQGCRLSEEEIKEFCKERLSPYKVPKSVAFFAALPHTEIGKVNKVRLREMLLAGGQDPPSSV